MSSTPEKKIEGFRLSVDQERLFSLHANTGTYLGVAAIQLDGPLDKSALRRALAKVIERNEILRTTFYVKPEANTALQVVANANGQVPLAELDLTGAQGVDDVINEKFVEFQRSDVDLTRYPLVQTTLLQFAKDRHVLMLAVPALCADNFTLKNIAGELRGAYADEFEGTDSSGMQVQYADFAAWQHELLQGEQAEEARSFWEKRCAAAATA